jgi:ribosomal-protein-alanine N-acetyltransferase
MDSNALPFCIEAMTVSDIEAVVALERMAYRMYWPRKAYAYELTQNELSHYFILRLSEPQPILKRLATESEQGLIGLGGFWLVVDEIHVSTLAIHPGWRRQGLGEWMLIALLEAGQRLNGTFATLEVRPSNHAARSLYQKYNFQEVGRRSNYYTDSGEDALILTTPAITLPDYQAMLKQRKQTLYQRLIKQPYER